ncbi:MAG: EAL domain-containing protein [Erysipelotrichaceae bacterium]
MKRDFRSKRHEFHINRKIPIIFALICLMMGVLCYQYYINLQATVKTEGSEYLQEVSMQIATNVNKTVDNNFSVLDSIATTLNNTDINTYHELQPIIREQKEYWKYQKLMLIDSQGIAYDTNGNKTALRNADYLNKTIVNRKRSLSPSQLIDNKESIVFTIPLENITIEGTPMLGLAISYDLKTFDQIIQIKAFNGYGYSHIIQKNGTVVIRSSSKKATQTGYNVLNSINKGHIFGNHTLDQIKNDIEHGKSGQIEYELNDKDEFMVYTPLKSLDWCLLTFIPTEVVNAKSNLLFRITLLLCAIITLSFATLFAVLVGSFNSNKKRLEKMAYVDPITHGNTIQHYNILVTKLLKENGYQNYAVVYLNIEKFKVLNQQFGRNACNNVLKAISKGIGSTLSNVECMARISADNFCILVTYTNKESLLERFDHWYTSIIEYIKQEETTWLPVILEFGIYVIDNDKTEISDMVDYAKLPLLESTHELHGSFHYSFYDEGVRNQLLLDKHLEDMMEDAITNKEFVVYLQPKYDTIHETVIGAEALIRWNSVEDGMIYPDQFISLFEKNGFVVRLDLYVFEEVCKLIEKWIKKGLKPFPISVNCSRNHLKNINFLNQYSKIAKDYHIPPEYIEIELTENTVFQNVELLIKVIHNIHELGFTCSMDDFGSGYSSLNLIQDIPVDILKIDKVFFHKKNLVASRTKSVLGSIIKMAQELSMKTVAEGVEEEEQVVMLKQLGCDYIQGYYYAKPMPIDEFEQLVYQKIIK